MKKKKIFLSFINIYILFIMLYLIYIYIFLSIHKMINKFLKGIYSSIFFRFDIGGHIDKLMYIHSTL